MLETYVIFFIYHNLSLYIFTAVMVTILKWVSNQQVTKGYKLNRVGTSETIRIASFLFLLL